MTRPELDEPGRLIPEDGAELELYESDEDGEDGADRARELGPLGQFIVALVAVVVLGVIMLGIGAVLSRLL
jgi:hypothetical protein